MSRTTSTPTTETEPNADADADDRSAAAAAGDADEPLLAVRELRTRFHTDDDPVVAVNDVSFTLSRGETMGIVGESGAGKSVTARSIMGLIDWPGEVAGGEIVFDGEDLAAKSEKEMQAIRGNRIALVPQDPMRSLNPVLTVGSQIVETVERHQDVSSSEAKSIAVDAMDEVGIPDAADRFSDYPHEFSGGMRQRVLVAIGLACEPDLIVADEPTTALDVTTQAKILDLLNELQAERGMAILLITHNLGVVAQTCDTVGVMYAGNLVEKADLESLFERPTHPYTRGLVDSIPETDREYDELPTLDGSMPDLTELPEGCNFAPRCRYAEPECRTPGDPELRAVEGTSSAAACIRADELDLSEARIPDSSGAQKHVDRSGEPLLRVEGLKKHFSAGDGLLGGLSFDRSGGGLPRPKRRSVKAVDGVDFDIYPGETVGLVGESGCGKSTVARTVLQLLEPTDGAVYFDDQPLHELGSSEVRSLRAEMQMIFQDPGSSLNPRKTVGRIVGRAMEKHGVATGEEKRRRVGELLERVGLSASAAGKYPHEFSGGQQQRVAIAHALAVEPRLIVCDEPVSALDVSVQAQILNLLEEIQAEENIAYLFISHNIGVVKHICDRLAVMYLGEVAEFGTVADVFDPPSHPYTQALLSAVPHADPSRRTDRVLLEGTVPSPVDPPSGCSFRTRCPKKIGEVCETDDPGLEAVDDGGDGDDHRIACHLSREEMAEPIATATATDGGDDEGTPRRES
jgi:peptide/nickel transport system ATP-binding protein